MYVGVPGLWMVETVSKQRTARELNSCWEKRPSHSSPLPLKVMVQVNTSREESELPHPPPHPPSDPCVCVFR